MTIKINTGFGVEGEFQLITQGPTRGRIEHPPFKNLILDSGLDRILGASVTGPSHCRVGTSNAAVSASQTALVGHLAETGTVQSTGTTTLTVGPPAYVECTRTWRFVTGTATGNLAEVGVGFSTVAGGLPLFSRALIATVEGSPTTITVLSDEQLDVVYKVRFYPSTTDATGNVTLDGTVTAYTLRFANWGSGVGNFFWAVPLTSGGTLYVTNGAVSLETIGSSSLTFGSEASNSGSDGSTAVWQSYTNGSFTRTCKLTWPLAAGNFTGGIRKVTFPVPNGVTSGGSQILFVPNANKTAAKVLTLDVAMSLTRRP